jgi:hypothetical protein
MKLSLEKNIKGKNIKEESINGECIKKSPSQN